DLVIYNSLGQTVKHFNLQPGASSLSWNAQGSNAAKISSGFYFVKLKQVTESGKILSENAKILYLK
ncbi:MAG: hypothetical protein KDF60_15060, partial [Calditrichaeota bacterium]|nr:hypothetical protein [Calditrichota bacterium]